VLQFSAGLAPPWYTLAWLDRVLRSAARLVGRLPKFSPISVYMRDVPHWLPISRRIQYCITAMVSLGVSFAAPPLTFVTSAARRRF